jgi:hypothetical protein
MRLRVGQDAPGAGFVSTAAEGHRLDGQGQACQNLSIPLGFGRTKPAFAAGHYALAYLPVPAATMPDPRAIADGTRVGEKVVLGP